MAPAEVGFPSAGAGSGRDGAFLHHGPDGIVAEAADEIALGVDDVLEELVVGVAAVDDVEALRLQRGP